MAKKWTKLEIAFLSDNYPKLGVAYCEQYLERSRAAINLKANKLGIVYDGGRDWLRKPEDEKVKFFCENCKKEISYGRRSCSSCRHIVHPHPRGMLGKAHTPEYRKKISERVKKDWARPNSAYLSEKIQQQRSDNAVAMHKNRPASNNYSRTKSGKRKDLNDQFFRSSWEANYARYLNFLIKIGKVEKWEFENTTFEFREIRRGTRSYIPDFAVWEPNGIFYYVEVKGWMDAKSKTKLKRMAKYYPDVEIRLVGKKEYNEIARKFKTVIKGWE